MNNIKIPSGEIISDNIDSYLCGLSQRENALSKRISDINSVVLEKDREIQKIQSVVSERNKENDVLKTRIRNLEKTVEEKNREILIVQNALSQENKEIENLKARIMSLEKTVEEKNREILMVQNALSQSKKDIHELNLKINKMRKMKTTPDGRFTDNIDGTVTDNKTGLMWKQCIEGCCGDGCTTGRAEQGFTWDDAIQRVRDVNRGSGFADYRDWRLPSVDELKSIVDQAFCNPSINHNVFPKTSPVKYWSSSCLPDNSGEAWVVDFCVGYATSIRKIYSYPLCVRLVRG